MKKLEIFIVGGDRVLWDFRAQEFLWASMLGRPLKVRTKESSLMDADDKILQLKDGVMKFLKWCKEEDRIVCMVSTNDFDRVDEVLSILGIRDYFSKVKADWQSKKDQLQSLFRELSLESGKEIEYDEICIIDVDPDKFLAFEKSIGSKAPYIQLKEEKGVKVFTDVVERVEKIESGELDPYERDYSLFARYTDDL